MRSDTTLPRRRFLGGLAGTAALGSLAGCGESSDSPATPENTDEVSGTDDGTDAADVSAETAGDSTEATGGTEPNEDASGSSDGTETTDDTSGTTDGSESEIDLREANVVDVAFESGGGTYGFDVTLHHDDDGEDGYANWWQVERLDGTQLGRRDLRHAHSRQPFTRSETIEVPEDTRCVVVRGHDQRHGYGGRAILVDLDSGATRTVAQGPEKGTFEASDCP
ncbi:MAG: hypothetical protein V5A39_00950 [Haloarculaceae archaeon]